MKVEKEKIAGISESLCACALDKWIERSWVQALTGVIGLCYWANIFLSQCLSPLRTINGYRRI